MCFATRFFLRSPKLTTLVGWVFRMDEHVYNGRYWACFCSCFWLNFYGMISKTARLNFVVVDCGEAKEKWILIVMRLIFFLMQRHELRMLGHFGHIASCYGKSFKAKGGFFSIILFFLPLFFFQYWWEFSFYLTWNHLVFVNSLRFGWIYSIN